ncbi:hypothetical protein F5146DRAFT_1166987 [Armillaria mellea]|nr:hypothetical protein F5146DRAFT_1166987 [Armillaria mellea]
MSFRERFTNHLLFSHIEYFYKPPFSTWHYDIDLPLEHFGYIVMEILGPSTQIRRSMTPMLKTSIRIGDQVVGKVVITALSLKTFSADLMIRQSKHRLWNLQADFPWSALFLLYGHLPWKPSPRLELGIRSQEIVQPMKFCCAGNDLSSDFPVEFDNLLDDSRSLDFDRLPDYETFRRIFAALIIG